MSALTHAMILAAGRGERMRPLTDTIPKPLLQVKGKALIDYHLQNLADAGITRIAINNAHLGEQIIQHVEHNQPRELTISHFSERPALETAGGIANALDALGDGPFLLINGDVFCDIRFKDLQKFASRVNRETPALIVGVSNPTHNLNGDFGMLPASTTSTDSTEALQEIVVDMQAQTRFTFSGISILHRSLFENLPVEKQALGPMLKALAKQHRLDALFYTGLWCDVGTPERLQWINEC